MAHSYDMNLCSYTGVHLPHKIVSVDFASNYSVNLPKDVTTEHVRSCGSMSHEKAAHSQVVRATTAANKVNSSCCTKAHKKGTNSRQIHSENTRCADTKGSQA